MAGDSGGSGRDGGRSGRDGGRSGDDGERSEVDGGDSTTSPEPTGTTSSPTGWRRYVFALAPLLAAAIWGGMYVVSKWGFSRVPPVTLGFFRVALGGLVLWAVVRSRGVTIDPGDRRRFVVLGAWVAATIVTQFVGTDLTNASQGSLLTVLTPVFTVGLGAAVLGEVVTRVKAAGIAVAGVGTLLVLAGQYELGAVGPGAGSIGGGAGSMGGGNLLGVGLLVAASLCWAGYTVWGVPVVREYSALTAATYSTLFAVPMLAVLAALEVWLTDPALGAATSTGAVLAIAYLGVASTAVAWYLWYKGLEYVPAGTVAVFFFAQPVVGGALGALLLDETVGPGFVGGGALMAVGIWVVSRERA